MAEKGAKSLDYGHNCKPVRVDRKHAQQVMNQFVGAYQLPAEAGAELIANLFSRDGRFTNPVVEKIGRTDIRDYFLLLLSNEFWGNQYLIIRTLAWDQEKQIGSVEVTWFATAKVAEPKIGNTPLAGVVIGQGISQDQSFSFGFDRHGLMTYMHQYFNPGQSQAFVYTGTYPCVQ